MLDNKIEKLQDLINVQCTDGNWNYDAYMHGLANGLITAMSVLTNEEPEFKDAPDRWLSDDTTAHAMTELTKALQDDEEYAYVWHCNIAMSMFDAMPETTGDAYARDLNIANDGASRFMKLCFDVVTTQDMLKEKKQEKLANKFGDRADKVRLKEHMNSDENIKLRRDKYNRIQGK